MESVGQKMRNYRRRPCPHSLGGNDEDEDDYDGADRNRVNDVQSNASDDGNQRLKQPVYSYFSGSEKESRIAAVDASVADSTSGRGGDDEGLCVSFRFPDGGKGANRGDDDGGGGGQNGARIASGIGFRMLRSMGWTENTGLGQSGKGMIDPILPTAKPGNLGVGFNSASVFDTQQEAIREVQRAKREERDRKLKLKDTWSLLAGTHQHFTVVPGPDSVSPSRDG